MTSEIRVNKIINRSGLSTVTFTDDGAIVSGIVTANSFSGNVTGNITGNVTGNVTGAVTGSGANLTSIPAGQLTGTLPAISGANLTGIPGTTINNNANNRIITGSGSANTLEGEANLTFDGTSLLTVHVPSATGSPAINFTNSDTGTGTGNGFGIGLADNESPYIYNRENTDLRIATNNTERMRINAAGNVGINQTSPSDKLHVSGTTNFTGNSYIGGDLYMYGSSYTKGIFLGGSGSSNKLTDYEEGTFTPNWDAFGGVTFSYSQQHGFYTKIGDTVTFTLYIQGYASTITSGNGSNPVSLQGLPFTIKNHSRYYPAFTIGRTYKFDINSDQRIYSYGTPNTTNAKFIMETDDSTGNLMVADQLNANTCEIFLSGTYKIE